MSQESSQPSNFKRPFREARPTYFGMPVPSQSILQISNWMVGIGNGIEIEKLQIYKQKLQLEFRRSQRVNIRWSRDKSSEDILLTNG